MLKTGSDIHLQDPGEAQQRVLIKGSVIEVTGDGFRVAFDPEQVRLDDSQEVVVYYEKQRHFVQQMARVDELAEAEEGMEVALTPVGDPVSAEGRQHYLVSTISADVSATLEGEEGCAVQDVSIAGFAVVSGQSFGIGRVLSVSVQYEESGYSGRACVQSVREIRRGLIRYGLRFIDDESDGADELRDGLQEISMAVQREQLRRQSGMG